MNTPITRFLKGFFAPLRAAKAILQSPKMLPLVAIPLSINLFLYVLFFKFGAETLTKYQSALLDALSQSSPQWLVGLGIITLVGWALKILGWLILGMLAAFTFTFVSGLISSPFNEALSRVALKTKMHSGFLNHSVKATVLLEAKRISVLVVGAIFALIIGIIPFMQIPALILGALLVSFEYFGYPVSSRSSSLLPVIWFTIRNFAVSLGFGSFLLLMMALPFTSIFYIPLAVVGGTFLYAELTELSPVKAEQAKEKYRHKKT